MHFLLRRAAQHARALCYSCAMLCAVPSQSASRSTPAHPASNGAMRFTKRAEQRVLDGGVQV
jgi:hypothetical protein